MNESVASETHLRIIGMTCGACAGRVEGALRGVAGVADAVVNLMSESAAVVKCDGGPSNEQLLSAVRAVGYDAEVMVGGRQLVDQLGRDDSLREKLRRHRQAMVQAVGLALPIVALEYLMPILWGPAPVRQLPARLLQLVLLVMLAVSPGGGPILAGGLRALWHRTGNMDLLISMGVSVAVASSLYGMFFALLDPGAFIHLHAAAMILALVCVGRYLEAKAKGRASQAMSALARRAPKRALVRRGEAWISTPVEEIAPGDQITIPEREAIPVDGEVVEGSASVDERLMTGEPMPVHRTAGDKVLGGTAVAEGRLVIRATEIGSRSALGRIMALVQAAQASRTDMQRLADRIAGIFTPVIIAIAAIVFLGWILRDGAAGAATAARAAVAVLVVACPCALGLATPTVVLVASGLAALRGILVRDAATLEAMGRLDVVVWDKTGTLTHGEPTVRGVVSVNRGDERNILSLAAGAEQFSMHPLATANIAQARRAGAPIREPARFESVIGSGVRATVDGREVIVGKESFLQASGVDLAPLRGVACTQSDDHRTDTIVAIAIEGRAAGLFYLADAIRPSAAEAVARLRRLGIRSEMLTGDSEPAALAVAEAIGIDSDAVHAGVSPEQKVQRVADLRNVPDQPGVAMVGDGVNDAAALATATVGIAFATGAESACEAAGIHLIGSTPHLVANAVELARASVRVIRQNLFWAFIYNVLMIPLAATGRLPPAVAAGAMMVSSLTVVANALRLPRVARFDRDSRGSSTGAKA
jgi:Cu+-exporting ATPase